MAEKEFLGIETISKNDQSEKAINKIVYESRKEYFRNYYKMNRDSLKATAYAKFKNASPEEREKINARRRARNASKRIQHSKGLEL